MLSRADGPGRRRPSPPVVLTVVPEATYDGTTYVTAYLYNASDGRLDDNSDFESTPVTLASDVVVDVETSRESFIVGHTRRTPRR